MSGRPAFDATKCLCLDIETARGNSTQLHEIGIFRPDLAVRVSLSGRAKNLAAKLNELTQGADFVLGHNIIAFDQPALKALHRDLALHELPLIDTLELSPLAFPQNPYHRLIKDYKLCTTTRNDPVRDAELAYTLFQEQGEALANLAMERPNEAACLHYLMDTEDDRGLGGFFGMLRAQARPSLPEAQQAWLQATAGKVCTTGQRQVLDVWLSDPDWHKSLAYTLAWLRVAGGNSVLPAWVGAAHPKTREVIATLRDRPCLDSACAWCKDQHDLLTVLPRYFPGIHEFRTTPPTADGRSLQQAIVENGFAGTSTLAILPTGGGKSLCFQLPALARYYRNGSLTVVISPLQSLMKDQVDNLEKRGITCAGYLNSLLTPLERQVMLNKLRLGDLGLIFVAPEQFRSPAFTKALMHRQVAVWVFDEAHCLSKWGHDFRPDYLYVSRCIKTLQQQALSPIFCFTATAKPDVVEDVCSHFQRRLGIGLDVLAGGVRRDNLAYEVRAVPAQAKYPEVLRLLQEELEDDGGAIVFCARQRTVEELATFLQEAGLACGYFHGGMLPTEKRQIQEAFLGGELRVIAATNAFGMGVDKPDVRLVIHLDTPGSLENYLQEAGRAGRDQAPARCLLLYDDTDLDVQFRLLKNSRLTQHDIHSILKALRQIERKDRSEGSVVVTSGEILLEVPERTRLDPDAADADTKVRIAVAWLEEAQLLERHENHTRVFPHSLQVDSLEAAAIVLRKRLGDRTPIEPYLKLLAQLIQTSDDEAVSTDELMLATGLDSRNLRAMLRELDQWKLLSNDSEIGVTLYRDPDSGTRLTDLHKLEDALMANLRETAPDADQESWQILNVRRLCDSLRRDTQTELDPERLSRLLKSFAEAFGDQPGQRGLFALRPNGVDNRYLKLLRSWPEIEQIRLRRMRLAETLLKIFIDLRQGNNLLVSCRQGELEARLRGNLGLQDLEIRDWDAALAASLIYLDTNEVLHLARGKAIFRTAMNITFNSEARRRQFRKSDYAELDLHYKDKIVQVHVMAEYARLALDKVRAAMRFIEDYFGMEREAFVKQYFAGRKEVLELATTEAAHRRILTELRNPAQQEIVAAAPEGNHLVLAGPGSGKTRIIVHRVAWLLRERMILPEEILVLAFNHSAAAEIRRRLWALIGPDAGGVVVQTLHGLAMRLTGTSYAVAAEHGETFAFDAVIKAATARLRKAESTDGDELAVARDRVLCGLRYILVDEYQDINGDHYELISALTGRTLRSEEDKLALLVVGDDDQNIYGFGGANVRYIRQFEADYQAHSYHLLENYRSTRHIIDCANRLIARSRMRMKTGHEIRIDQARRDEPAGGAYAHLDPVARGQVHVLEVPADPHLAVQAALAELVRLASLTSTPASDRAGQWGRFAVIARHWHTLEPMAALCRLRDIPVRLLRDQGTPQLHATREGDQLLSLLRAEFRRAPRSRPYLRGGTLARWFRRRHGMAVEGLIQHPFKAMLARFILACDAAAPGSPQVTQNLIEALYEFGSGKDTLTASPNGPMILLTAHRAKGLEFDHVLILDGGGWMDGCDEERRLFYVAMTRARQTLTLCEGMGSGHAFVRELNPLVHRSPCPGGLTPEPALAQRCQFTDASQVVLSWPGYFAPTSAIHQAIRALEVGSPLQLRPRPNGQPGWEVADQHGTPVTRMARCFTPPPGRIMAVRVHAILARKAKADEVDLHCRSWEVVLPEFEYLADAAYQVGATGIA